MGTRQSLLVASWLACAASACGGNPSQSPVGTPDATRYPPFDAGTSSDLGRGNRDATVDRSGLDGGREDAEPGTMIGPVEAPEAPSLDGGPSPFLMTSDCNRVAYRNEHGDPALGGATIRVRVRIARSASGVPATTPTRVAQDIARLNAAYSAASIRFEVADSQELPPSDAYYNDGMIQLWHDLSAGAPGLMTSTGSQLWLDALPLVYVRTIAASPGVIVTGYGNRPGVVLSSDPSVLDAGATRSGTIAQEVGHYLGLDHTHACHVDPTDPSSAEFNGDRIVDTPRDPGPSWHRKSGCAQGTCTQNPTTCAVTCGGGEAPDGRNYMSYYDYRCTNHFTADQIRYLRCALLRDRTASIACPSGQSFCDGACRSISTTTNCGACGIQCASDQTCATNVCRCPSGQALCGGRCQFTPDGGCGAVCPSGQVVCNGSCVDVRSDRRHCGACGSACAGDMTCTAGTCACPSGRAFCLGACRDLSTDNDHCGACFRECTGGQQCSGGVCRCASGRTLCGSTCRALDSDPASCGACGRSCPAGAGCVSGRCQCMRSFGDDLNCGECGHVCGAGQHCRNAPCPGSCILQFVCCLPEVHACTGTNPCPAGTNASRDSRIEQPCRYVCCAPGL